MFQMASLSVGMSKSGGMSVCWHVSNQVYGSQNDMTCRRLVLPPTCTKLVPSAKSEAWTSRAKSLFTLPTKSQHKGAKGKGSGKARGAKGHKTEGSASATDTAEADDGKEDSESDQLSQQVCTLAMMSSVLLYICECSLCGLGSRMSLSQ